jgi:hypothetical protein
MIYTLDHFLLIQLFIPDVARNEQRLALLRYFASVIRQAEANILSISKTNVL